MPGRSTLTATARFAPSSPAISALCTWAIDAAATGGENDGEERRRPACRRRLAIVARASSSGNGSISSRSRPSVVGGVAADDVRPGRQELAELDVGRPEPVERRGQPLGAVSALASRRSNSRARRSAQPRPGGQRVGIDERRRRRRGRARSRRRAMRKSAATVPAISPQSFQPEWIAAMPPGEVAIGDAVEAGILDHRGEARLVGKAADRFDQIFVGLGIAGHEPAERRNDVEGEELVEPVEPGDVRRRRIRGRGSGRPA